MMTGTPRTDRYALSFTSGALLATEAAVVAPVYLREHDWKVTRKQVKDSNLLQHRVASSSDRTLRAQVVARQDRVYLFLGGPPTQVPAATDRGGKE